MPPNISQVKFDSDKITFKAFATPMVGYMWSFSEKLEYITGIKNTDSFNKHSLQITYIARAAALVVWY